MRSHKSRDILCEITLNNKFVETKSRIRLSRTFISIFEPSCQNQTTQIHLRDTDLVFQVISEMQFNFQPSCLIVLHSRSYLSPCFEDEHSTEAKTTSNRSCKSKL